jgi:hypothetical protein
LVKHHFQKGQEEHKSTIKSELPLLGFVSSEVDDMSNSVVELLYLNEHNNLVNLEGIQEEVHMFREYFDGQIPVDAYVFAMICNRQNVLVVTNL